jgi:hypothetical protein
MLPQIVESRKAARAVALEWTFSCMLSDMPGKMLAPRKAQITRRIVRTIKALRLLLLA